MSSPSLTRLNPADLIVDSRFLTQFGQATELSYCRVRDIARRGLLSRVRFDVLDGPQRGECFERTIAELCVYQPLYYAATLH